MNSLASFYSSLNGARYVKYDDNTGRLFVWFGGKGINIYNLDGNEVDHFNLGPNATEEDAIDSIEEYINDFESND